MTGFFDYQFRHSNVFYPLVVHSSIFTNKNSFFYLTILWVHIIINLIGLWSDELMYLWKLFYKCPKRIWLTLIVLIFLVIVPPNLYAKWDVLDTFEGHTDKVNSVAFSTNGQILGSGSNDGTIILWNPLTGQKIETLTGHYGIVYAVTFGPNELLASACSDGKIILWNSETFEAIRTLQHNGVRCIAFSPNGEFLASGSQSGTVKLWNPKIGREMQQILEHEDLVSSIAFSPDGMFLATGSHDSTVRLWGLTTQQVVKSFNLPGRVHSVTFKPDDRIPAAGLDDGTIKLWKNFMYPDPVVTQGRISQDKIEKHEAAITSLAFNPQDQLLASASLDGTIKLWDLDSEELWHLGVDTNITLSEHHSPVTSVVFSPDGKTLVSGSEDGTIRLWQDIVLSTRIKNKRSFPKTINSNELLLAFTTKSPEIKANEYVSYVCKLDNKEVELPEDKANFVLLQSLEDGKHTFEVKATSSKWEINPDTDRMEFTVNPNPETKITSFDDMTKDEIILYFTGFDAQTETTKLWYQWRIDGKDWSNISKEKTAHLKQLSMGVHVFEVRAIDTDGNFDPTPARKWFTVDIPDEYPQTRIKNPPTGFIKPPNVTFVFDGYDLQTPGGKLEYSWRLNGAPWSTPSKEKKAQFTNLSAGYHLFQVKAIDTDYNEDPIPAEAAFEVEEQLPNTFIVRTPESPVETVNAIFEFFGKDLQTPPHELRYSWSIDGKSWSYPSTKTRADVQNLSSGQHIFEVKAIDRDGNEDPTPVKIPFEISEQFPDTKIEVFPKDFIKTQHAVFKFTGYDSQTEKSKLKYSWRIDSNPWSEPTQETMVQYNQKLTKGSHLFEVKTIDEDGNEDPTPDRKAFTVADIEAEFPETQIISPHENDVLSKETVEFQFIGVDKQTPVEELQYSWRSDKEKDWVIPSSQTMITQRFSDGQHRFEVKAIDTDKYEDPTPAEVNFTVDGQRRFPDTQILNVPRNPIKTSEFIFQLAGIDLQTYPEELCYLWRIDYQEHWSSSPDAKVHLKDLSNGLHHFEVKAVDTEGNEDPTPARADFQVAIDKELPSTKIEITVPQVIYTLKDFEISFNEIAPQTSTDRLRYSWRFDNEPWSAPSLSMKARPQTPLSDGLHFFEVKAVDSDGNEDPIPASIRFLVDTKQQYPETEIISILPKIVETTDVTIRLRGYDLQTESEKLRYSWRIIGKPWSEPSEEPIVRLTNLSDGSYWFQVKAIDTDDNEDPMPAEVLFKVAINKKFPNTRIVEVIHKGWIKKNDIIIRFRGDKLETSPKQLGYSWRLDDENWSITSTETMVHLKNLSNGQYHFQVKARDEGYEDPTPAVALLRVVVPPFYKNPFSLVVITVTSLIILFSVLLAIRYARQSRGFQEEFNPYQAGEPIIEQEKFYGRTVELDKIKSMLQSGSVIVHGERRIGKTSILRHIEQTIDGKFIPCFVQLGDATEDTFFRKIREGIATGCNRAGILTNDLLMETQHDGYDGLNLRDDIKLIIDRVKEADQDEKLLVIIDEVDVTNSFPSYIQESIRAIAQDFTQSLKFLVAGTYIQEAEDKDLSSARPSAWYNAFRHIEIEPFGEEEACELIKRSVGKAYRYSSKAVDYILAQSLKRPYVIQLICYHIIEHMKIRRKTQIKLEDAEIAFSEAVKEFHTRLKNLWVRLPGQVQRAFKTQGYLEHTGDNEFIELLEKEGIVWHDELNTQPSPIFAEWIRRNQR